MTHEYRTALGAYIDGECITAGDRAKHRVVNPPTGDALGKLSA